MNRTFTLCFSLYPIALPFGYVLIYTFYHYAVPDANSNLAGLVKIAEFGITDSIPLNASSKDVSTSISFKRAYTDPVIIATLCGGQGYIGAGCKVMNITSSGAVFRTYTTTSIGGNYSFYISYIVLEKE